MGKEVSVEPTSTQKVEDNDNPLPKNKQKIVQAAYIAEEIPKSIYRPFMNDPIYAGLERDLQ